MKRNPIEGARRPAVLAAAACLLLLCGTARARCGEIRGIVRVTATPATASGPKPNPYPGQIAALAAAPRSGAIQSPADAVIYLVAKTPATAKSAHRGSPNPELRQRGQAFVPRVLPIRVGSTVTFPNEDPFYHNVFSYSSAKRFDLGRYGSGKSRNVIFDKPGLVKVFCEIHSDMAAYILVLESDRFVSASADGRFVLTDVPPGEHTVKAWHPDHPEWSTVVTVPAEGAVELDIPM